MSTRGMYLIGMLVLLFLANVAMLMGMTNWPQRTREGFAAHLSGSKMILSGARLPTMNSPAMKQGEAFMDYLSDGFATASIGSYDGINMAANLPAASQGFRARLPNVLHPAGTAMLPFVNNECKPECCGSTMSCDGGGCVCTTPEDRDLINTRGGNRRHEDGF